MLGSPSIMRDEDISIPFPEIRKGDEAQNTYAIHAILSSHLGKILDGMTQNAGEVSQSALSTDGLAVIYGVHDQQQKNFLVEVKTILSRLAETSVVLREHLHLDIQQPGQPVSRDAATLHLLLHQV